MGKGRLETFSDAVLAIIITITVLLMKVPVSADLTALGPVVPFFISYIVSFVYVAIYWNNHHHMLFLTREVNAQILWANLHLLFWLSLVPFVTGWMGENHFAPAPTTLYGFVLLMVAIAYYALQRVIIASQGHDSVLAEAMGRDIKGRLSPLLYALAIPVAYFLPVVGFGMYVLLAMFWLIPDRRIQRAVTSSRSRE